MKNFFYCQPALNYGYKQITRPWQLPMDHPDCMATRRELLNIMDFWCDLGATGFRVDMAHSLVKDDPTGEGIRELWQYLKSEFLKKHPGGILIAEWGNPGKSIPTGFDIDFLLHFENKAYTTLFRYEKGTNQSTNWIGESYFRTEGRGDINEFLDIYLPMYEKTKDKGYISLPTGNHDMPRISLGRDTTDLKIVYTFLMTMPGVPFVYYGDEIGMKYIEGLTSKEGGYNRTGARTPMQWNGDKNFGFSDCDETYLPVDTSSDAPHVEKQLADENSLINYVKTLIKLRKENRNLWADVGFEVIDTGYPFIYQRGDVLIVINPKDQAFEKKIKGSILCGVNANIDADVLNINGKGAAIVDLKSF